MKSKIALCLTAATVALAGACTSTPTWDRSVFPPQAVYGGPPAPEEVVEAAK